MFFLATAIHAQDDLIKKIAPLINKKTIAVAHFNVGMIDFDKLSQLGVQGAAEYVTMIGFDKESIEEVRQETALLLEKKLPAVREKYDELVKLTGIRDIYFIAYQDLMKVLPGVLATPLEGKTQRQIDAIKQYVADNKQDFPASVFETGGFLVLPVCPPPMFKKETMPQIKKYFADFKAEELPALNEAFTDTDSAILRVAAIVPENMAELIQQSGMPPIPLPQVAQLLYLLSENTRWANASLDLYKTDFHVTIQMDSEKTANEFRETLVDLIEFSVATAKIGMEQNEETADFAPLFGAYMKGIFKVALPKVKNDKLVYEPDPNAPKQALVPVAVVGVMVALLLPAVQAAREAARRMQCSNNLKQITLAMHNYHDAQKTFPPAFTVDKNGKPLHSWRVLLLPYMEQQALYSKIRLNEPWDSEYNSQFHDTVIPVFVCPSNPMNPRLEPGLNCHYSVVIDKNAAFSGAKPTNIGRIVDGLSNTVMIVERKTPVCWMDPSGELTLEQAMEGINASDDGIGSFHTGGINAAFCDGSVQFLSNTIDLETLKALILINDGISVNF